MRNEPQSPRLGRRAALLLLVVGLAGCVVKDELKNGMREMRGEVATARLDAFADGSGHLAFTFQYGIALVDDAGIDAFPWEFRLVDRDRRLLAFNAQEMRKAEPEKTRVLVTGERVRSLEIPAGTLRVGETYVVWLAVDYRDDRLFELLSPVVALEPGTEAPGADAGVAFGDADFGADADAGVLEGTTKPVPFGP
jgi:hypothetical protein